MKLRKRILSLVLAVMLVVAMAVPASAANRFEYRTGSGCTVAVSAECSVLDYSAVMEYQNSNSGNPMDYTFQVKLVRTTKRAGDTYVTEYPQWSTASTRIAGISGTSDWVLSKINCDFYINNSKVGNTLVLTQ